MLVTQYLLYFVPLISFNRFRDVNDPVPNPTSKRYVISSPPDKFVLVSSDLIFCLMQFDYCAGLSASNTRFVNKCISSQYWVETHYCYYNTVVWLDIIHLIFSIQPLFVAYSSRKKYHCFI